MGKYIFNDKIRELIQINKSRLTYNNTLDLIEEFQKEKENKDYLYELIMEKFHSSLHQKLYSNFEEIFSKKNYSLG